VKPAAFDYHAPTTAAEAAALLTEHGDAAKLLAGGQRLVPMLALRLTSFDHLIDLGGVAELHGIDVGDTSIRIGSMTTQAAIEQSAEIAATAPLLARATPLIGHFQIRNRGTIGGSLAHADPAAEYPAVVLTLDAELEVLSPAGVRVVPASEFFTGLWATDLNDEDILTAVTIPRWTGRCGFAIDEFARRHGDFAIAGAAVALELDNDDRIRRCHIGVLGLGSMPERAVEAEAALAGAVVTDVDAEEIGRLTVTSLESVPSDLHGSADYRRRVGAAMVARAWRAASEEARRATT
jgi:aerobic carbon-monoxide dehydrogenase medium subunit